MGNIRGWKRIDYKHRFKHTRPTTGYVSTSNKGRYHTLVNIIPPGIYVRGWGVKINRVNQHTLKRQEIEKPFSSREKAREFAVGWMRRHPNG